MPKTATKKYFQYYKGSDNWIEFSNTVGVYAEKLGVSPTWFFQVFLKESTLNPQNFKVDSKNNTYRGLAQLGDEHIKEYCRLNKSTTNFTTPQEFNNLNGSQQMPVIFWYFKTKVKGDITKRCGDVGLALLRPSYLGKDGATKLKGVHSIKFKNSTIITEPTIEEYRLWIEDGLEIDDVTGENYGISQTITINEVTPSKNIDIETITNKDYIEYQHVYSDIDTIDKLIEFRGWITPETGKPPKKEDLLDFKDNRARIRSAYNFIEMQIENGDEGNYLKIGTLLLIPIKWGFVGSITVFDGTQNIIPLDNTETFIHDALKKVVISPNYDIKFQHQTRGGIKKIIPRPRVWVWVRALGIQNTEPNQPKFNANGALLDVSPFISNLNISTSKTIGNFSFNLPPLMCRNTTEGWVLNKDVLKEFKDSGSNNFIAKSGIIRYDDNNLRNEFFFHLALSNNDLVFITFDDIESDPINGVVNEVIKGIIQNPTISTESLAGRFFDMIGLIDTSSQSIEASNGSVSTIVRGRDLMKLLIEDSTTYLATPDDLNSLKRAKGLIKNDNDDNWGRPLRSILSDNKIWSGLAITAKRTIGEMISFIISNLASIEIAPDYVFDSYKNQQNAKNGFGVSSYLYWDWERKNGKDYIECEAAGIWKIIKLQIDKININDRYVINNTLPTYSGSIINAIKTYVDDNFVEIFGDTYLDQYFLIVRRPPYNEYSINQYVDMISGEDKIDGLTITADKVTSENLDWYNGDVYCWYALNLPTAVQSGVAIPYTTLPVVFFREYCEIWGSKGLQMNSQYLPWNERLDNAYLKQTREDLAYIVETNAYLPFTRTGTITIKSDRRIKRGIWIKYAPTGEIFYVDSVSRTYTTNNKTCDDVMTLNVSRGMVHQNKSGQYILPYYFKLIDGLKTNKNSDNQKRFVRYSNNGVTTINRVLNIYFDFDKSQWIDPYRFDLNNPLVEHDMNKRTQQSNTNKLALENFVDFLKTLKDFKLVINGHTDENGSDVSNMKLSKERAEFIKNEMHVLWLQKYKENNENIRNAVTVGHGSKNLFYNQTSKGLSQDNVVKKIVDQQNRRIEVSITYTQDLTKNLNINSGASNNGDNFDDYSNWRVNQDVFNFFKTKKQFSDEIPDLENVGNYTVSKKPKDLNEYIVDKPVQIDVIQVNGGQKTIPINYESTSNNAPKQESVDSSNENKSNKDKNIENVENNKSLFDLDDNLKGVLLILE